jgi:hypothetical protein
MTSNNAKPRICRIPGCGAQAHGNLLCRRHYDAERYEETTKGSAKDQAAAEREQRIRGELCHGCVAEWQSPYGTNSMFETDAERRAGWEERRDEIMEKLYTGTDANMGHRPWAWWQYDSGRPDLHSYHDPPRDLAQSLAHATRISHLREVERFTHLAESGFLTDAEIEKIAAKGREAKARIGTTSEHKAHQSPDHGGDKLAAARADAVIGALKS